MSGLPLQCIRCRQYVFWRYAGDSGNFWQCAQCGHLVEADVEEPSFAEEGDLLVSVMSKEGDLYISAWRGETG